ncbi:MAG: dienelactone hydrolase family protein [Flavobacteriales bacterium]|nr:dienelactone hydrolase family protein [Flavobacteriales bacterium]NUQ15516.1 dienelactone hydrolase family protein [Flavobacteriales bacterium]
MPRKLLALVDEMNTAGADRRMTTYARCGHTFTGPASTGYDARMAARAWRHTLLFLREVLDRRSTSAPPAPRRSAARRPRWRR